MKRAPVIPKHTIKTQPLEDTPSSAPAAPMVDSLIARVGAMARGNAITLPVCGRDVKFTLEVLRGDSVEKTSRVWSGNERDQNCLPKTPSMILSLLSTDRSADTSIRSKSVWGHRNCRWEPPS